MYHIKVLELYLEKLRHLDLYEVLNIRVTVGENIGENLFETRLQSGPSNAAITELS
jgi:hypothetical protein